MYHLSHMKKIVAAALLCAATIDVGAQQTPRTTGRWWMDEPIRFLQTNISEKDSTLDPTHLVEQVADFPANTFLFNMGGIVAQYLSLIHI